MKVVITFLLMMLYLTTSWMVGISSNIISPTVNGRVDYVKEVSEHDKDSPGTFIQKFDVGALKIGNGQGPVHWVRDHQNCTVSALRPNEKHTLIVVGCNVYMIFKNDWEVYYDMVRKEVGTRFGELKFISHADHNHHGIDTSGIDPFYPINDKYFEYMLKVMVKTTVEALSRLEKATLHQSEAEWAYGMIKNRDPRVLDKGLRILQAKSVDGQRIIATIVQWNNHPEVTLGIAPKTPPEDCQRLGTPNCSAKDRYVTSDFVGVAQRILLQRFKSYVLYLNGAVGLLIAPLRADVWEPSERFPIIGDGGKLPEGATAVPRDFRKTFLIGRELANKIERTVKESKPVLSNDFIFKSVEFYTRISNIKFRVAAAALRPGNRSVISYSKREAYLCSNMLEPSDLNCKSDDYQNIPSRFPLVPIRKGNFFKSITNLVDFGSMKWLTAPAEIPPELFVGLPSDFLTNTSKYYNNPQSHAYGKDYVLPGYGRDIIKCTKDQSCWIIGLGGDELGYSVIMADYRIKCPYTNLECKKLPLTFPEPVYAMSGKECKWVVENPEEAKIKYGTQYDNIDYTCQYGLINQVSNHYEETNGMGWDLAEDYIKSIRKLFN